MCTNLVSLADGCPRNGAKPNPISNPPKSARGGVRCCSKNGQDCKSRCNYNKEIATLAEAQRRCGRMGRRLCTADELASNKCCGTGCHYDDILTWQTGSVSKSANDNPGKKYPKKTFRTKASSGSNW